MNPDRPLDEWWLADWANGPAAPADPEPPARARPPFLEPRTAAARVELVARRALDDAARARDGLDWYENARRFCAGIGRPYGLSVESTAGALAALSPQVSWDVQTAWAPAILDAWKQGAPILPGPGYGRNRAKAARILDGAPPLDVLGGPKVRAFYRSIVSAGATDAVCIDRHAWAIAGGGPALKLTDKRYREAARAYVDAAAALRAAFPELAPSLTAARVQALTWVWWRDNAADRF